MLRARLLWRYMPVLIRFRRIVRRLNNVPLKAGASIVPGRGNPAGRAARSAVSAWAAVAGSTNDCCQPAGKAMTPDLTPTDAGSALTQRRFQSRDQRPVLEDVAPAFPLRMPVSMLLFRLCDQRLADKDRYSEEALGATRLLHRCIRTL